MNKKNFLGILVLVLLGSTFLYGLSIPTTATLPSSESHPSLYFSDGSFLSGLKSADAYHNKWYTHIKNLSDGDYGAPDSDEEKNARAAKLYAFMYIVDGTKASEARACLMDFANNGINSSTPWTHRASMVINYCLAFDWIFNSGVLSGSDKSAIRSALAAEADLAYGDLPRTDGTRKMFNELGNIKGKAASALGMVAMTIPTTSGSYSPNQWLTRSLYYINEDLNHDFGPNNLNPNSGIDIEGPHYLIFTIQDMLPFFWAYKNRSGVNLFDDVQPAFDWMISTRLPNGLHPNSEDGRMLPMPFELFLQAFNSGQSKFNTAGGVTPANTYQWAFINQFYPNEQADLPSGASASSLMYPGGQSKFLDPDCYVLYKNTSSISAIQPDISRTMFLTNEKLIVLGSDWNYNDTNSEYLYLKNSDQPSGGDPDRRHAHDQPDGCTFHIFSHNALTAFDEGYGPDLSQSGSHYSSYYSLPISKNQITVDDYPATNNDGKVTNMIDTSFFDYGEIEGNFPNNRAAFIRGAAFVNNEYYIVIDSLNASSSRTYRYYLHGYNNNSMSISGNRVSWSTRNDCFSATKNVNAWLITAQGISLSSISGYASLWTGQEDNIKYLKGTANTSDLNLLSIIHTKETTDPLPEVGDISSGNVTAATLANNGNKDVFLLQQGNNTSTAGGLTTDAELAWVRDTGNVMRKSFIRNGRFLIYKGKTNIFSSQNVTLAWSETNTTVWSGSVGANQNGSFTIQFLLPTQYVINYASLNGSVLSYANNGKYGAVTINGTGKLVVQLQYNASSNANYQVDMSKQITGYSYSGSPEGIVLPGYSVHYTISASNSGVSNINTLRIVDNIYSVGANDDSHYIGGSLNAEGVYTSQYSILSTKPDITYSSGDWTSSEPTANSVKWVGSKGISFSTGSNVSVDYNLAAGRFPAGMIVSNSAESYATSSNYKFVSTGGSFVMGTMVGASFSYVSDSTQLATAGGPLYVDVYLTNKGNATTNFLLNVNQTNSSGGIWTLSIVDTLNNTITESGPVAIDGIYHFKVKIDFSGVSANDWVEFNIQGQVKNDTTSIAYTGDDGVVYGGDLGKDVNGSAGANPGCFYQQNNPAVRLTLEKGNIYYAAPGSGAITGSGTFADPWKGDNVWQMAMRKQTPFGVLQPGDIVYFKEGTYNDDAKYESVALQGAPSAPIFICAITNVSTRVLVNFNDPSEAIRFRSNENPHDIVLKGFSFTNYGGGNTSDRFCSIRSASNISIISNHFLGNDGVTAAPRAISLPDTAAGGFTKNIVIQGNVFTGRHQRAINAYIGTTGNYCDNVEISDNYIEGCSDRGIYLQTKSGTYASNIIIKGNEVLHCVQSGIEVNGGLGSMGGIEIKSNIIHNNFDTGIWAKVNHALVQGNTAYSNGLVTSSLSGLEIKGSYNQVRDNTIYAQTGSSHVGLKITGFATNTGVYATNVNIVGNTLYGNSRNLQINYPFGCTISNNNIYQSGDFGIFLLGDATSYPECGNLQVNYNNIHNNVKDGIFASDIKNSIYKGNLLAVNGTQSTANVNNGLYLKSGGNNIAFSNSGYLNGNLIGIDSSGTNQIIGNIGYSNWNAAVDVKSNSSWNIVKQNQCYGNMNSGIRIFNGIHNTIVSNVTYNNIRKGIWLLKPSASSWENGIHNEINYNKAYGNGEDGINVSLFSNNVIGNETWNNTTGIYLKGHDLLGKDNICHDNLTNGFKVVGYNMYVTGNIAYNQIKGIMPMSLLSDNIITRNSIFSNNLSYNNSGFGFMILNVTNCRFIGNVVHDNGMGLFSKESGDNFFEYNNVYYQNATNSFGIYIKSGSNNRVDHNITTNNYKAINVTAVDTLVISNKAWNNIHSGICINDNGLNTYIMGNNVQLNNYGINLWDGHNSIVTNNYTSQNNYGIYVNWGNTNVSGNKNKIVNNEVAYNINSGIFVRSLTNYIAENHVYNNMTGLYIRNKENYIAHNIIQNNATNGIKLGAFTNVCARNLYIYTNYSSGNGRGIQLYFATNNIVKGNFFYNNIDYGVMTLNSASNTIISNQVYNNSKMGVYNKDSKNNLYANNIVYRQLTGTKAMGIYIKSGTGNILLQNEAYSNFKGFNITADSNYIENNKLYLNRSSGVCINSNALNNYIYNNQSYDNRYGIELADGKLTLVTNNLCYNNTNSGIYVNWGASTNSGDHNYILNNEVYGSPNAGIYVRSRSNFIRENNVHNNVGSGISCRNTENQILDNIVKNNTTNGIKIGYGNLNYVYDNQVSSNETGIKLIVATNNIVRGNVIFGSLNAGIQIYNSGNTRVSENTINKSQAGRGIMGQNGANSLILNNQIQSNTDGIWLKDSAGSLIVGNIVSRGTGDGIYIGGGNINAKYNTVAFNNRGIRIYDSSTYGITNNITYSNNTTGIYADAGSHTIYYSCVADGIGGAGVTLDSTSITSDPLFVNVNVGQEDFRLDLGSPCYGTGTPLPVKTSMGAYNNYIEMDNPAPNAVTTHRFNFYPYIAQGIPANAKIGIKYYQVTGTKTFGLSSVTNCQADTSWGGTPTFTISPNTTSQTLSVVRTSGVLTPFGTDQNLVVSSITNVFDSGSYYIELSVYSNNGKFISKILGNYFGLDIVGVFPPVINEITATEDTNGTGNVLINYTGIDTNNDTCTYVLSEYSTNNIDWHSMTANSNDTRHNSVPLGFTVSGASLNFVWDSKADLGAVYDNTVWVRLQVNDGTTNSSIVTSSNFIVDNVNPAAPGLNSPTNNAWANATPKFNWTEATDVGTGIASYDIVIDGVTNTNVTGTNFTPSSALSEGTNAWTVRAIDKAGNVGAFSITNTVNIDTTGPNSVSLSSPVDGSKTSDPTPTFSWNTTTDTGSGVAGYEIDIDGAVTNIGNLINYTPSSNLSEGTNTWKVRAYDAVGNTGSFSASRTVIVDTTDPNIVTLNLPVSNSIIATTNVTFKWDETSDATTSVSNYIIQIATNSNFSSIAHTKITNGTSFTVTDMNNGATYYWRVRAYDVVGNTNDWSSVWSVSIDTNQIIPTLLSPINNTISSNTKPTFYWSHESGISSNQISITTNGVTTTITLESNVTNYSVTTFTLPEGTNFWKVRVYKTTTSSWQAFSSVNTYIVDTTAPGLPVLTSPETNAVTSDTTPTFTWTAASDANGIASYDIVIGSITTNVTGTNFTPSSALSEGTNTWTVLAIDKAGNVGAFATNQFVINTNAPSGTIVIEDLNGLPGYSTNYSSTSNVTATGGTANNYIVSISNVNGTTNYVTTNISTISLLGEGSNVIVITMSNDNGIKAEPQTNVMILDTQAPTNVSSVSINNGDSTTTTRDVTITLDTTGLDSDVVGYYISEENTPPPANSGWNMGSIPTNVVFPLSSGEGTKTVSIWVIDSAGNISAAPQSASITYKIATSGVPNNTFTITPNPLFKDETMDITYGAKSDDVKFEVYTMVGSLVKTIKPNPSMQTATWDGKNDNGKEVASGIYLMIMRVDGKMVYHPIKVGYIGRHK